MKRSTPKEVWLHHSERAGWTFSFDPPLKLHSKSMHRMVSADVVARQRAEIRRLRAESEAQRELLKRLAFIWDMRVAPGGR